MWSQLYFRAVTFWCFRSVLFCSITYQVYWGILDILDSFTLRIAIKTKTSHCDNAFLSNAHHCVKFFEISQCFLAEKMDDLTKQLFDDVRKEESQRMYGSRISFVWSNFFFLLFLFLCFSFSCCNYDLCTHHLWVYQHSWTVMLVLTYFMYRWRWVHACRSVRCRKIYWRFESLLALFVSLRTDTFSVFSQGQENSWWPY